MMGSTLGDATTKIIPLRQAPPKDTNVRAPHTQHKGLICNST